ASDLLRSLAGMMASAVALVVVSCYGEVILNLLRGGSIAGGGDGDTNDDGDDDR
ncbi:hypothetical protein Tco_0486251, partial [Tanacetum coccineum]